MSFDVKVPAVIPANTAQLLKAQEEYLTTAEAARLRLVEAKQQCDHTIALARRRYDQAVCDYLRSLQVLATKEQIDEKRDAETYTAPAS